MEQLWNRGDATGGKGSTRRWPENGLNYRQTVATGCHRLPFGSHGKEGVNGSSPLEGFRFSPAISRLVAAVDGGLLVKCPRDVRAVVTGRAVRPQSLVSLRTARRWPVGVPNSGQSFGTCRFAGE